MGYGHGFDNGVSLRRGLVARNGAFKGKTVFSPDMVAHVWAQQKQPYGSAAKGTIFFEGDSLYSYGYHYCIARLASVKGKPVCLFNAHDSSVTTNKQRWQARRALSGDVRIFEVFEPEAKSDFEHQANIEKMQRQFAGYVTNARNTRRSPSNRLVSLRLAEGVALEALDYRKAFLPKQRNTPCKIPACFDELRGTLELEEHARILKKPIHIWRRDRLATQARGGNRLTRHEYAERLAQQITAYNATSAIVAANPQLVDKVSPAFKAFDLKRAAMLRDFAQRESVHIPKSSGYAWTDHTINTAQGGRSWGYSSTVPRTYLESIRNYPANRHGVPKGYVVFDRYARGENSDSDIRRTYDAMSEIEKHRQAEQRERVRLEALTPEERLEAFKVTGLRTGSLYRLPCALFVKGATVLTSWGAEFPTDHARRVWPIIKRIREGGNAWTCPPNKAIRIGHFAISSISADGTLKAGCHTIAWQEIERAAATLDLD